MANGWQQAPAPSWAPAPPQSGLLKAGTILLLVGAILSAAMALLALAMTLFMGFVLAEISEEVFPGALFTLFYGGFGLLMVAGAVCGFVAWRKAQAGDLSSAFVWGLVGSLLPPLQILLLLGAIFAKVCPEAEAAAARSRQAWAPPPPSPPFRPPQVR
jgi:hypothetical protein